MFPCQEITLPCRFPVYVAFPCSEYYQQVRLPPQLPLACGWSVQLAYSVFYEDRGGSPRFLDASVSIVPCSQTPPRSPVSSPLSETYCCFPGVRPCQPLDNAFRLNRFTYVTARMSLCLCLTRVVTFTCPRLDFGWIGYTPCQVGISSTESTRLRPGAPKQALKSPSMTHSAQSLFADTALNIASIASAVLLLGLKP